MGIGIMVKIDIFSGFLGAGKTTLIKKLLEEAYKGERVVLIENEFGDVGIDGGFLKDAGIEITEMNSGCICCSLVGDFTEALKKVIDELTPERIIIEPSGVGKLSDIIKAVKAVDSDKAVLNCFTTVCDATKCKMYMKNFGEFYNDQVTYASAIVLSHTDTAPLHKVEEAIALIRQHNSDAVIVTTPIGKMDGRDILRAMETKDTLASALERLHTEVKEEHHHHHEHGEDECCHGHHHHEHDEDECCHGHHHEHDEDECCYGHHHEHDDDECCHGHHHHEHGEDECCHGHHHHEHDEDECCHEHHHEHHHHHEHGEGCSCGCGGHHHADEVFVSIGVETTRKFTKDGIENALSAIDEGGDFGTVLRAKGIVECECGSWLHFDYVPGHIDVRVGSADIIGRLCVIGSMLNEEKIKALFGV